MKSKFRYVLFDLGNVVFKIEFDRCFKDWSDRSGVPVSNIKSRFAFDNAYSKHEKGELTGAEYHQHICEALSVPLSFVDFKAGWNAIYGEPIAETIAFLRDAGEALNFAAFTNSNATHREFWSQHYASLLTGFEKVYCSSQIKFRKPEKEGFEFIMDDLKLLPTELIFVDDLLENVQAAKSLGIEAVHYDDPARGVLQLRNLVLG